MTPEEALKHIRTLLAMCEPEATTPKSAAFLHESVLELVRKGLGEPETKTPKRPTITGRTSRSL